MLSLLIAGALLIGPQGGADALVPDSVLRLPEGPELVVFHNPGASVTAIRVAVRLDEPARNAGAARVLQAHSLARVRTAASSVGAQVSATRTPWGIAYTVVGPQTHFEYLAWILREAVSEPNFDRVRFLRARAAVEADVERSAETPHGLLSEKLWNQLSPGEPPTSGTHATISSLTPGSVRDLWARTHRPDHMSVVIAGPASIESSIAAFKDLKGAEVAGPPRASDGRALPNESRGRTQVLRSWYGQAFVAGVASDPHAEVLALLAGQSLRTGNQGYEAGVELWELGDQRVLAVTGAAYGRSAGAMQSRIRGLLTETRTAITPDRTQAAATRIQFQLLSVARAPEGLVNLVGRHMDGTGDPGAARRYVDGLDGVTAGSLGDFLSTIEASGVTAEVRP